MTQTSCLQMKVGTYRSINWELCLLTHCFLCLNRPKRCPHYWGQAYELSIYLLFQPSELVNKLPRYLGVIPFVSVENMALELKMLPTLIPLVLPTVPVEALGHGLKMPTELHNLFKAEMAPYFLQQDFEILSKPVCEPYKQDWRERTSLVEFNLYWVRAQLFAKNTHTTPALVLQGLDSSQKQPLYFMCLLNNAQNDLGNIDRSLPYRNV